LHALKTYEKVEVELHTFLTSSLVASDSSVSRSGRLSVIQWRLCRPQSQSVGHESNYDPRSTGRSTSTVPTMVSFSLGSPTKVSLSLGAWSKQTCVVVQCPPITFHKKILESLWYAPTAEKSQYLYSHRFFVSFPGSSSFLISSLFFVCPLHGESFPSIFCVN